MRRVSPDTVFLVGSGIVERSWEPIISAINAFKPEAGVKTEEQANYFLAWWVYARRLSALHLEKEKFSASAQEKNRQIAADDLRLKQLIAAHLRDACERDEIRLRQRFLEVQRHRQWGSRIFLTTDWDRLLEIQLNIEPESVLHIHGNVETPSHLYLPTETSTERYRDDATNKLIGVWTGTVWQKIRDTRQLCIYGLSLSATDIELSWILSAGISEHTAHPLEIHLFNLRRALPEMEWRVRMVCQPGCKIEITAHPIDDDAAWRWSS